MNEFTLSSGPGMMNILKRVRVKMRTVPASVKLILMASVFPAITSFSAIAADTGSINFTGRIIDESCTMTMTVNGTTGSDVQLGNVYATTFTASGDHSTPVAFNIALTGCPANEQDMNIQFGGEADGASSDSSLFNNVSTGSAATGVGVAIYDGQNSDTKIPPNTASAKKTSDTDGNVTFDFTAAIEQDSDKSVTAGDVSATTDVSINYN